LKQFISIFVGISLLVMVLVDQKTVNGEEKHLKEILDPDGYEKIVSKCMEWDQEGYLDDNRLRLQAPDYWLMCTQLVLEEKLNK
jgi:hypothetical protein